MSSFTPPTIQLHYISASGQAMEATLDNTGDELTVAHIRPQEQQEQQEQPKQVKKAKPDTGCKTCAAKGLKRLLIGGAKLLKSELGIDASDEETQIDRRNLCESCEHYDFGVCKKCGCFCAASVKLKQQSCPEGKW